MQNRGRNYNTTLQEKLEAFKLKGKDKTPTMMRKLHNGVAVCKRDQQIIKEKMREREMNEFYCR